MPPSSNTATAGEGANPPGLSEFFRKYRRSTDVQPSALQQSYGSFGALNSRDPASARRLEMLAQPLRSFEILPGLHLLPPSRSSQ